MSPNRARKKSIDNIRLRRQVNLRRRTFNQSRSTTIEDQRSLGRTILLLGACDELELLSPRRQSTTTGGRRPNQEQEFYNSLLDYNSCFHRAQSEPAATIQDDDYNSQLYYTVEQICQLPPDDSLLRWIAMGSRSSKRDQQNPSDKSSEDDEDEGPAQYDGIFHSRNIQVHTIRGREPERSFGASGGGGGINERGGSILEENEEEFFTWPGPSVTTSESNTSSPSAMDISEDDRFSILQMLLLDDDDPRPSTNVQSYDPEEIEPEIIQLQDSPPLLSPPHGFSFGSRRRRGRNIAVIPQDEDEGHAPRPQEDSEQDEPRANEECAQPQPPPQRRRGRNFTSGFHGRRRGRNANCPNRALRPVIIEEANEQYSEPSMYEVEDVEYQPIVAKQLPKGKANNWRVFPRYSLNRREAAQQELELFRLFTMPDANRGEETRPPQPGEPTCCVCLENIATRVVTPCGHQCLCFTCAETIALNRTIFYGDRVPKFCPICQAVIGTMAKVVYN